MASFGMALVINGGNFGLEFGLYSKSECGRGLKQLVSKIELQQ